MRHRDIDLPCGDVLLHCGDVLMFGGDPVPEDCSPYQVCLDDFLNWLRDSQKEQFLEVVFIGGNHDGYIESIGHEGMQKLLPPHVTYLCDSEVLVAGGVRIYGTGFSFTARKSANSAFQTGDPEAIRKIMETIPTDVDVLMTHGAPQIKGKPFGLKPPPDNPDMYDFGMYGCDALAEAIRRTGPRVHVFGHVHDAHGAARFGETLYIAASTVSSFKTTAENSPIVFDLPYRES